MQLEQNSNLNHKIDLVNSELKSRLDFLDKKLEMIADSLGIAKPDQTGLESNGIVADRKRLKERMQKAMKSKVIFERSDGGNAGWLEYLFGICESDHRKGKIGSRWPFVSCFISHPVRFQILLCFSGSYIHSRYSCKVDRSHDMIRSSDF
jgi:hypothetical protein